MKKLLKVLAVVCVLTLALGICGKTDVKAGGSTESLITEYEPVVKVETDNKTGKIKITLPKQSYYSWGSEELYPTGYEVTLEVESAKAGVKNNTYTGDLYKLYYSGNELCGYGPYEINNDDTIGVTNYIEQDGSKDRTYEYLNIGPGKYTVKVRAYANEVYKNYSGVTTEYKWRSIAVEKSVTLGESKTETIDFEPGYKTKYDFSKVKQGDTIKFGSYEQDGDFANGREPIEWIVLSKTSKQMLVISKYCLDSLPYNAEDTKVTWETCTLRKWLNSSFYDFAFNKNEKKLIQKTTLKNDKNPSSNISGGKDTKDNIFLLSLSDVLNTKYGFSKKTTAHDEKRRTSYSWNENAGGRWWLRTPAKDQSHALFVGSEGSLEYEYGAHVFTWSSHGLGVRPAMYISIK